MSSHGINGLIYISGIEIAEANAWSLSISQNSVEVTAFGDAWVSRVVGAKDWSGSIAAFGQTNSNVITDAATAGVPVAILIYPDRNTATSYYSGNAIFGMSSDGNTTSAVSESGDFVGSGTLTITGFA